MAEQKRSYNELLEEYEVIAVLKLSFHRHRNMQASLDNTISELNSQLKVKAFEMERTMIAYEEINSNLKQSNIVIDQQRKKIDVRSTRCGEELTVLQLLTAEYYNLKSETHKKLTELEATLNEKEEKLTAYEALEKDLDAALLSVGQGPLSDVAFDIDCHSELGEETKETLFAFSNVNMPNKRRVRQTLQLTRKVMELQRVNMELTKGLESRKQQTGQLTEEV